MIGAGFEKGRNSSRGIYIRITSDMLPKRRNMRNLHIPPNRNDMRSIAYINHYMKGQLEEGTLIRDH